MDDTRSDAGSDSASDASDTTSYHSLEQPDENQEDSTPDEKQEDSETTDALFALTESNRPPSYPPLIQERDKWNRPRLSGGPGTFICPDCGKALARLDSLTRHRRTRHRIGRQYYCGYPQCAKTNRGFGRVDNFRTHMKVSHGVILVPGEIAALEDDMYGDKKHRGTPATNRRVTYPANGSRANGAQTSYADTRVFTSSSSRVHAAPSSQPSTRVLAPTSSRAPTTQALQAAWPNVVSYNQALTTPQVARPVQNNLGALPQPAVGGQQTLESLPREELIRRLRLKAQECEQLQQRCNVLSLEKEEYAEALNISEEMRRRLETTGG